jgi:hypothetical protein
MVHFVTVSLNSILDHHHLAFRVGRQQKGLSANLRRQPAYAAAQGLRSLVQSQTENHGFGAD